MPLNALPKWRAGGMLVVISNNMRSLVQSGRQSSLRENDKLLISNPELRTLVRGYLHWATRQTSLQEVVERHSSSLV